MYTCQCKGYQMRQSNGVLFKEIIIPLDIFMVRLERSNVVILSNCFTGETSIIRYSMGL